ncbi:Uncharacterised protein [Actinomyces bovis]|uniref:Uncharacterized protein n=2 Tax=Actinomyces bovis TaxID=1658 RepID=A0ABY1VR07_9ACTO|nr:Uncharacterised protein [Actinomyces bovis]
MHAMYEQRASLERVGDKFVYTAGTARKHLIIAGVVMRNTHGRVRTEPHGVSTKSSRHLDQRRCSQQELVQSMQPFAVYISSVPAGALEPAEELDFTSLAVVEVDASTGATSTSGATGTSATVLAPNAPLSQILDWRTTSLADELDAEQALRAITAIITRERPNSSRTVFVASERSNAPTAELAARVRSLLDSPWVRGVSFSEMASSEPTDVERVPPPPPGRGPCPRRGAPPPRP